MTFPDASTGRESTRRCALGNQANGRRSLGVGSDHKAVHPRLKTFFNGAYKTLEAAFERSIGSSSTRTGTVRHGDLMDAHHRMSGQLDGMIVHAGYLALGGSDSDAEPRIVLAEGAVAVMESKADMQKNWGSREGDVEKVIPLRRSYDPLQLPRGGTAPHPAIPFIAVGYKGWDTRETLAQKAEELLEDVPR